MSVTAPKGFRAAGVAAGLKPTGAKDVALVVNDSDPASASAAAVFTANRFAAAPVRLSRATMARARGGLTTPRAVVLNSGGANACTGPAGDADAAAMAELAAAQLGLRPDEVLVCSTGLIGERLPMDAVRAGIRAAARAAADPGGHAAADAGGHAAADLGGHAAAEAIMTTDTAPKEAVRFAPGGAYTSGGMAKGAGMLAPELATMLVVLTTDALVDAPTAQSALEQACERSFNRIDSDGCMSTNDTVILLASGASGRRPAPADFADHLTDLAQDLARQLIRDAEGASHEIEVEVTGALTEAAALAVARGIVRSNLFKTAIAGNDPNWGRILAAAGTVPVEAAPFAPDQVDVLVNGVMVCRGGGLGEPRGSVDLSPREVHVTLDLHAGAARAAIWTNDLTAEYVSINADYSS